MRTLKINVSDEAAAHASNEAAKRGLADAEEFAAKLLEESAGRNGHSPPSTSFFVTKTDLDVLIESQNVKPVTSLCDLRADFWPGDESADDLARALREWNAPSNR